MANLHWTDDVELLERYVLGRVIARERQNLESHLGACEQCRSAVRSEREIVAGVKRLARDGLKQRLRKRVGTETAHAIPWPHVMAAAAVIVILVGVGIYQDWFAFYTQKPVAVPEEEKFDRTEIGQERASREESPALEEAPARSATGRPSGRSIDLPSSAPSTRDKQAARDASELKNEFGGAGAVEKPQEIIVLGEAGRSIEAESQTFWVDGVLLPHSHLYAAPQSSADELKKQGQYKAAEGTKVVVRQDSRTKEVVLNQRSIQDLPLTQKAKRKAVRTLVEQKETGIQLTLYPETPFDEQALRDADVDPVGGDSLILRIGDQQIGYRIPGAWTRQMPAKEE